MHIVKLILILTASVCILRAEVNKHCGISGGFGLADVTHQNFIEAQMPGKVDENVSFHAGGFVQALAFDLVGVQADFQYIRRGYVIIDHPYVMSETSLTDRFNIHYLEVPVTVRLNLPISKTKTFIDDFDIQLFYGRSLAYLLEANRVHEGAQEHGSDNITDAVNNWDWGQTMGIEVNYPRFLFGFKVYQGDRNVFKQENLWACRNASWTIYMGYRF